MKNIILFVVLMIAGGNIYSQSCMIMPIPDQDTLNCGDSLNIGFNVFADIVLQEPFTANGPTDSGWVSTGGAQYDNPYIPSPTNDAYFWLGPSATLPTSLTTAPFNISAGGQICFDFVYAAFGGSAPIEQPDLYNEGISLQFNAGFGWWDIIYFPPSGGTLPSNPNGVTQPSLTGPGPYEVWTSVCVNIPLAAQGPNTSFQWIQENNSSSNFDHWGLDNVEIFVADTTYEIISLNDGINLGEAPAVYGALPTTDSVFYFMYTNFTTDTCFGNAPIVVNPTELGPDLVLDCNNNVLQLEALGVSQNDNFTWSPTTGLDDSTILNPLVSPLDTTQYIFNSSCGADTVNVNVISNFSFSASDDTTICAGEMVFLEAFGGAESYAWTPNDGSINDTSIANPVFSPTSTTTYTVTADSTACIKTKDITVEVSNKNILVLIPTHADCNGNNNGGILAVAGNGIGPLSYRLVGGSLDTTANTGSFQNLAPGTYNLTISDDLSDCPLDTTIVINGGFTIEIDSIYSINPLCVGDTAGRIEIFIDTSLAVNYSLNGGPAQSSNVFSGLTDGAFDASVIVSSCISQPQTVTLSAPATIDALFESSTDLTCFESSDGQINVSATMGVQPYQYSLDNVIFQSDSFFNNLSAGTYAIYAMDANGCRDSIVSTITEPVELAINNVVTNNLLCFEDSLGSISYSVQNGIAPFQYSIDSGLNFQNSEVFNGLAAGVYELLVVDSNACASAIVLDTVTQPDLLSLVLDSVTSSTCGAADGTISVIAMNGTGPYTFSIDTGLTSQTSPNFTNLVAGVYNILLTDNNMCTENIDIIVPNFGAPTLSIASFDSVLCNGQSTAMLQLSASGGLLPYSFSNGGVSQQDSLFTNLSGGVQNFSLTDGNGCISAVSTVIYEPTALVLTANTDSTSCSGMSDGQINAIVSGGVAPYMFAINNTTVFQSSSSFSNLLSGSYTIFVQDANGCISNTTIQVYDGPEIQIDDITITDLSCNKSGDGSIVILASGGGNVYSYAIDDTAVTQMNSTFDNLNAGTSTAFVFDENGCFEQLPFTILEPDTLIITAINPLDISCNDEGSFTVIAQGGTPPYTYTLNGTSAQTNNIFTIPNMGTYTLGVTDSRACDTATSIGVILAPNPVDFEIDSATNSLLCNALNNGLITIAASGGNAPYEYSIDNGISFQVDSFFTNLAAGSYEVIVRDVFGCLAPNMVNINISEPDPLVGNSSSEAVNCVGNADGVITINNVTGGTLPYTVMVDSVVSVYNGPGLSFTDLEAGTYAIEVTDDNGCLITWDETLQDAEAIIVNISTPVDVSCFGAADGEISVSVSGGRPNYEFNLVLGSFSETINSNSDAIFTNLAGSVDGLTYTLTIEDENGCENSLMQTITQPSELIIESIDTTALTCFGFNDATMTANVSGGSSPYTYLWTPSNQTSNVAVGLSSGIYTVAVTDDNNCTVSASNTILNVLPVLAEVNPDTAFVPLGETTQLNVTVQNAIGSNLQYYWTPSEGLSCTDCINPVVTTFNNAAYTVTVIDENGCSSTNIAEGYIVVDGTLFYFIPNSFSPNNDGTNDVFQVYGEDIKSLNMQIYNRWGELVFVGNSQLETWDGTYKGILQQTGVYAYVIEIEFLNEVKKLEKGSITLFR